MATLFEVLRTSRAALADVNGLTVCVERSSHLDAPHEATGAAREIVERIKPLAGLLERNSSADRDGSIRAQLDDLVAQLERERTRLEMEYPTRTGYEITAEFPGDLLPFADALYFSLDTVCADLARRGVDASADYWRPDPDADPLDAE